MKKGLIILVPLVLTGFLLLGSYFFFKKIGVDDKIQPEIKNEETVPKITSVIVPHFDLAASKRKELFAKIASKEIKTVVIVSPNHSGSLGGDFTTTTKTWNFSNGILLPEEEKIRTLIDSKSVIDNEVAFSAEQGIVNILPDIKQYYPEAKIIPIIIKENVQIGSTKAFYEKLSNQCSAKCLLVASVDFSHYQPGALAEIHDDLAIRSLYREDEYLAYEAEIDSHSSLAMSILWAKDRKTQKFNLFDHSNSGIVQDSNNIESTSYVLGYYSEGDEVSDYSKSFTFMFGGDMMTDRNVDYHFRGDNLVNVVKNLGNRVFWGTDVAMVNLEGPVSDVPIEASNKESLVFNMPPKTIDLLKYLKIGLVSLANNHTLNDGNDGFIRTKGLLKDAGIASIGYYEKFDGGSVARIDNGDMQISIIAIDVLANSGDITATIKSEKTVSSRVVVFPHWGEEYQTTHNAAQENLAKKWIDAGADMVIGSHPHVVQDAQVYNGKPIFYSLGNFIFDQDWSIPTQKGLLIGGKFTEKGIELVLLPIQSKNYQPEMVRGVDKLQIVNNFRKDFGLESCDGSYGCDKIVINSK